jgi:hypothetical protein
MSIEQTLPRTEAPTLPARSCSELHNARHCAADLPYYQPVRADEDLACDDSRLRFRFRIEETRWAYGTFGFFSPSCGLDLRTLLDAEGRTPAQLAEAYVNWLTGVAIIGLTVRRVGAEIEIEFPAGLSPCGCELRFDVADDVAFGQVLEQPRCCERPGSDPPCTDEPEYATVVFRLFDDPTYVYGNPAHDLGFWPTIEGDSCARYGASFLDPNMRMSHAVNFRDYLFKAHYHLQRLLGAAWGRSLVWLDADTGTFTLKIDRAHFEATGFRLCDLDFKLCVLRTGVPDLKYQIVQQPRCCDGPPTPCTDPLGFVSFEIELHDDPGYVYGNPAYDVVYNLDYSNSTCPGAYAMSHPAFRLSAAANFEQFVQQSFGLLQGFYSGFGGSWAERVPGTGRLIVYLDRDFYTQQVGFDPCTRNWMICQYSNVDGTALRPPRLHAEIRRQPRCCPPNLGCAELNPAPDPEYLDLEWRLPDRRNLPTAMQWGWWLDGPAPERWLVRAELTDGCCQVIDYPAGRFVLGSWVSLDTDGAGRQALRIDPRRIPRDCFGLRITLNDPCGEVSFYTEPWRKTTCEPTLRVEAEGQAGLVCHATSPEGPPHLLGTWFAPLRAVRLPAVLDWVGIEREEEESGGRTVAVRRFEVWRLRSALVPAYVAAQLEELLPAARWWIEGRAYEPPARLVRNRTRGQMWALDVELRRRVG